MRLTEDKNLVKYTKAQDTYRNVLRTERNINVIRSATYTLEDTLNGLSGYYTGWVSSIQTDLQKTNYELYKLAQDKGITLKLYPPMLPNVQIVTETQTVLRTGKKLYPKTVTFSTSACSSSEVITYVPAAAPANVVIVPYSQVIEDEIDPEFDALDAEEVTEAPMTYNAVDAPFAPMMSNALIALALTAAANANGLQAGLTTFSHNPLASDIDSMRDLLIYYTEGNYANLNTALVGISSNPSLNVEYKLLREAIGGPDGLSGCVAQLDAFLDHTNRLSGLTLDADSPNAEATADSTQEYLNLYGLSGGPQIIFRFNARRFRSAKYLIQATAADADRGFQVNELYILHDGFHAYTREIAAMYSENPFVTFTTRLANGNIEVYATTTADNTDFVIHGTRLQVSRSAASYANISQSKIIENHQTLANFLNDGVDYIRYQSGSLYNAVVVRNIKREMTDLLVALSRYAFLQSSVANQSATINTWATLMATRANLIQDSIETDYEAFVECGKKSEALTIAYGLAQGYEDANANTTLESTLNSTTKIAIVDEDDNG